MIAHIVRYAEIGLKGRNRRRFEDRLAANMRAALLRAAISDFSIKRYPGRFIVSAASDVTEPLRTVFGIASISTAQECDLELEGIKKAVLELLAQKTFESFRVTVQRLNKAFPISSQEMAAALGAEIVAAMGKRVSLKAFDLNVQLELMDRAYIFFDRAKGLGGLPVGIEGVALLLLEDQSSLAAGWLAMKRGVALVAVGEQQLELTGLERFAPERIQFVKLVKLEEIDLIASEHNAKALIVNDTMDRIREWRTALLVLRPLVGEEDAVSAILELLAGGGIDAFLEAYARAGMPGLAKGGVK